MRSKYKILSLITKNVLKRGTVETLCIGMISVLFLAACGCSKIKDNLVIDNFKIENIKYPSIMDTLKGDWIWFKTSLEGRGEGNNQFKSVIKILSQNEDESINYEVFVADTLFYAGSFQVQEVLGYSYGLDYRNTNIKLPHEGGRNQWLFLFLGEEEIYFYSGAIGPIPQNFYHYQKIGEK